VKTKSPHQSAFLNLHILIALVVFITGIVIALFATAGPWEAARQGGAQLRPPNHVPLAPSGNVVEAWVARYNGPGNSGDIATAMAVDNSGNVYVTGASTGVGPGYDYATIKYNSAGQRQWVPRYNGPGNSDDTAQAIAVDSLGNVYVTGTSIGSDIYGDYATIKYNSAGQQQWVARYDGPGHEDYAAAIVVDSSGNVYVTGTSTGSGTSSDYATIKYNSAGQQQWVARYDQSDDVATTIGVDGLGNVYVTGGCCGIDYDYGTVKYNSGGQQQWVARYDGPANSFDTATAIALDNSGAVYVTGQSNAFDTGSDYATIKYNATGQREWVVRYAGPGNSSDEAGAIAVDTSGNVYVTGHSSPGYGTIKYNSAGQQQWVAHYNHPGYASAIAVDISGNVYVTGGTRGFGYGEDYATVKYNSAGQEQWVARYDGPGPGYSTDHAGAIAIDALGNVYVTGGSLGSGTSSDYATIKYVQEAAPTPTPTPTPTAWPSLTPRPLPTRPPPTYPPRPTRPPRPTPP
jgi:uncharacterized delta-60 repeat protein